MNKKGPFWHSLVPRSPEGHVCLLAPHTGPVRAPRVACDRRCTKRARQPWGSAPFLCRSLHFPHRGAGFWEKTENKPSPPRSDTEYQRPASPRLPPKAPNRSRFLETPSPPQRPAACPRGSPAENRAQVPRKRPARPGGPPLPPAPGREPRGRAGQGRRRRSRTR